MTSRENDTPSFRNTNSRHSARNYNRLDDNRHQIIHDVMIGYNTNIRDYNQNITRALSLMEDSRHETRTFHRYMPENTPTNTPINTTRTTGTTRSHTFNRQTRDFSDMFTLPLRNIPSIWNTRAFQDVIISPTETEINDAIETFTYADDSILNYTTCPITREEFSIDDRLCRIHHCGHLFHESAIRNWFRNNVRCPMCRYDIREYTQPSNGIDVSQNTIDDGDGESVPTASIPETENDTSINAENELTAQLTNLFTTLVETEMNNVFSANTTNRVFSLDIPMTFATTTYEDTDDETNDTQ